MNSIALPLAKVGVDRPAMIQMPGAPCKRGLGRDSDGGVSIMLFNYA
jgi:hypothetical protein